MFKKVFKRKVEEKISPDLVLQNYFDEIYYISNNEDVKKDGGDPFEHYKTFGSKEGRNPNRWFEVDYYLKNNPDIILDEANPFVHYITFGWKEKRLPNSYVTLDLYNTVTSLDEIHDYFTKEKIIELKNIQFENNSKKVHIAIDDLLENYFDKNYYLSNNKDVIEGNLDPFEHYKSFGSKEGRNPNRWFDVNYYLKTNSDVKLDDKNNPFVHYLIFGWKEKRLPNLYAIQGVDDILTSLDEVECYFSEEKMIELENIQHENILKKVILDANAFDIEYYLDQLSEDEIIEEENAFDHYLSVGWLKQYNPNKWFKIKEYLKLNPDIGKKQIEPLGHYLAYGKDENRMISVDKGSLPFFPIDTIAIENIDKLSNLDKENKYVDYVEHEALKTPIKPIAFYLPQFHPFPENDKWWGKGFTEWTNVSKAKPNFVGHYQPHLPIHYGFYDLRVEEVMIEQARLAKNYGIYGFNYYYYWFDGKILLDLPLKNMLKNKKIDIPFCLTWANENWTRRWDGAENDILMAQKHNDEDSISFIRNLFEYFHDERYITVDGMPVLIIYRANIIPEMKKMTKIWRKEVQKEGFDDLYLISAQTFGITSPDEFGFDASMEFPPHTTKANEISDQLNFINPEYEGHVFNYETAVITSITSPEPKYDLYRTTMLGWDNSARKQNVSHTFSNYSTYKFQQWFSHTVNNVYNNKKYKNDFVFINAWNEWAEGTHLEPDRKFGYASLDAVYDVVSQYRKKVTKRIYPSKKIKKKNDVAVILHLHYLDMWDEIANNMSHFGEYGFDLYISVAETNNKIVDKILKCYPDANIFLFENRGRDIYPFIRILTKIIGLDYFAVCKIHSKKSLYRQDGSKIKDELFNALIGSEKGISEIIELFKSDKKIGLVVPEKYSIPHTKRNMKYHRKTIVILENIFQTDFEDSSFPAGSMYWFKPDALKELCFIKSEYIPTEEGWADGTMMHTIERFIEVLVTKNGFNVVTLKEN